MVGADGASHAESMTTTLITGATKGIGRETARRLIDIGHAVYVGGRDLARTEQAASELGGLPLVIVNVSSGLGSLTVTTDPSRYESTLKGLAYPSSKSALNMITSQYAKTYPAMRINAVDPGYTATDLNGHRGTQTVEVGAEIVVQMAQVKADGPTGGFFDVHGVVPW
jgi:NAD(P)-dependent dehydrogenase (short-subunit alcohol dehydrogenase family)